MARGGEALLSGEYSHSLDAKGRIILPAKLREEIGEVFYVTRGFEGCLAVYSDSEFKKLGESIQSLPGNMREVRRLQRIIVSGAISCEADKQGRFVIPPHLREFAKLEREVVVVGNGNHAEIWDAAMWNEYLYGEDSLSLEDAAEVLREAGLSM
jgi:MraZ protein